MRRWARPSTLRPKVRRSTFKGTGYRIQGTVTRSLYPVPCTLYPEVVMPVMINLTTADHGGTSMSCGTHESCGIDCNCGCPYTGMEAKGRVELIAEVEQRYPEEWLGFVIPPGEDEFAPERAMLVVHSDS